MRQLDGGQGNVVLRSYGQVRILVSWFLAMKVELIMKWYPRLLLVVLLITPFQLRDVVRAENAVVRFSTHDHGDPGDRAPVVTAWKRVKLDPDYGGLWVVTGDVDGDGEVDIVSCENVNRNDVHYTSTAVAQRLDGSVIWRWGDPSIGRKQWSHDVACQIYDWDGDGQNEVILCTQGMLVELDGRSGKERRRLPIARDATDCLVFANLTGKDRATDVLVKNRYHQIWAYDQLGKPLWTVRDPGGFRTAHQPRPIDLDRDGRDEIMAGYAMLNADGSLRWTFQSNAVDLRRGHLDCMRVLRSGNTPSDFRLILTCCGANNIACVGGDGHLYWEQSGHHFESVQIGRLFPDVAGKQVLVDIDHRPHGKSPLQVFDNDGRLRGQIMGDYCRHHEFLDWMGDGYDEILIAYARGVFDARGRRIATFATGQPGYSILLGDMTGDGVGDVTIVTESPPTVHIFKNSSGTRKQNANELGCGVNFTLY